ncbi:hypothetical protein [Aurantimonas sp. Leaf443]|uniref:hypothetical protein n=1 Tax=Aurantimonas sp. Leaf443 TaxID=1736378 RepID=UPI0006FEA040|nr:hypothetical protein [Aurantimonas sp. Leaf443]KQT87972.1 hypothetical protein ASG48_00455 [Aurantimonas sp. Leaf443]
MSSNFARLLVGATLLAAPLVLSGCLGPTYGTGKSQGETLFDDIDGLVSLGGSRAQAIDYKPRPGLVKPENTSVLPPPQTRVAGAEGNWPESPEQRSARIRASAYQAEDGELVSSEFATKRKEGARNGTDLNRLGSNAFTTARDSDPLSPSELRSRKDLYAQRLQASKQGSPQQRAYLSEPPLAYRQPAASAPVGVQGEDESVKERRIRNDTEEGLGTKLRNLLPF